MAVMNDTKHMRDAVFFEGPDVRQRLSRFWILITLASIIAAAGVAADSTATVIGAMIVAPLMTPILGTMLSVVLADRANLTRSLHCIGVGLASNRSAVLRCVDKLCTIASSATRGVQPRVPRGSPPRSTSPASSPPSATLT